MASRVEIEAELYVADKELTRLKKALFSFKERLMFREGELELAEVMEWLEDLGL